MRILLLSDEPRDDSMGGPKVTLKLQRALVALGHECDLMFQPELGNWPHSARLRLALAPWLARRASRRARRLRGGYDVIDASSAEGWMLSRRDARAIISRSHGLEHRYYAELLNDARAGLLHKPWTHRWWFPVARLSQVGLAVRRSRRAIVLSRADRDAIIARGWRGEKEVDIIPHGVDHARWEQAPAGDAPRGAGLLFCGWWTTSKGVHYLARAHELLVARGHMIPLTLLGIGVGSPHEAWNQLRERVLSQFAPASRPLLTLLPRTHDEDAVFAAYRNHDLLVCPSTSEGFGLVVMEALSQRLPVICSATIGAADWLRDGVDATFVPARDAEALAQAIAGLWSDPRRRRALGEAGHETAGELTWEEIARRTVESYNRCAATV